MNNNSSKQILLSVLGVAILVVAVVGVSFAAFTFSQTGTKENTITTGTITLSYTEGGDGLSITDAFPTSETAGKKLSKTNEYFDFTVDAQVSGTATIDYAISAEKVTESGKSTLKDTDVRLYLEEVGAEQAPTEAGTTVIGPTAFSGAGAKDTKTDRPAGEMVLKEGTITKTETKYYRLRMWLDADYGSTDTAGQSFKEAKKFTVKVNVYANAPKKEA